MRPGPIQKLKSEPTQQEPGATNKNLKQTTAKPALPPERDTRPRQSEAPTSDISTAVERKNSTGKPEHKSVEREHVVREQLRRRQSATPAPPADARPSGTPPDHSNKTDEAATKALGTTEPGFLKGLYQQLFDANARGDDKIDYGAVFSLAVLKGAKPKDELDAMHVVQMAAINMAIIKLSGELARLEYVPHLESITRAITQLARTYTAQLEARERYRTGGEQKVTVQNVSVTEGSQAFVGNMTQAAHGAPPDELANTTLALTDARQPAMEIVRESERIPIPLRKKSKT